MEVIKRWRTGNPAKVETRDAVVAEKTWDQISLHLDPSHLTILCSTCQLDLAHGSSPLSHRSIACALPVHGPSKGAGRL